MPGSIDDWLAERRAASRLVARPMPLADCEDWSLREGRMVHRTGGFFSVVGVEPATEDPVAQPSPFIDQPEIGLLGFLVRRAPNGIEWLIQAKTEPGNTNGTQLAPTVQATRSNQRRLHGGRDTRFLSHFQESERLIADTAQSEQGSRFLLKFNRNAIAALRQPGDGGITTRDAWRWFRSDCLRDTLGRSFVVNTDARSVLVSGPWSLLADGAPLFRASALRASYDRPRTSPSLPLPRGAQALAFRSTLWRTRPLDALPGWQVTDTGVVCDSGEEGVTFHAIEAADREVRAWCQPLVIDRRRLTATLLTRLQGGQLQVFLRRWRDTGHGGRAEFGPSQRSGLPDPARMAEVTGGAPAQEVLSIRQSDEGGRFMRCECDYRIAFVEGAAERVNYPFGSWVSLGTLQYLCGLSGVTTNELRTLVSLLLSRQADEAFARLLPGG